MARKKLVCMGVVLEPRHLKRLKKLAKRHNASKGTVIRAAINYLSDYAESQQEETYINQSRIKRGKNE